MRKPTPDQTAARLKFRADFPLDSIVVQDFGKHPDTIIATHEGHDVVDFVAPNGRIYRVQLEGNVLRVSAQEGGLWVRPRADNLVMVANLTPFEREVERGLDG